MRAQECICGGLNKIGPSGVMCLDGWPIGSGTIRWCGFIEESVSLWSWALKLYMLKLGLVWQSPLLPANQDVELSASSLEPCLPAPCHVSRHDNNELSL